jgi:spermidine synthase
MTIRPARHHDAASSGRRLGLVPAVLVWARTSMVEVFGKSLTDPRVSVREADVGHLIRTGRSPFDAILLDVDNGPEGLTRKPNDNGA